MPSPIPPTELPTIKPSSLPTEEIVDVHLDIHLGVDRRGVSQVIESIGSGQGIGALNRYNHVRECSNFAGYHQNDQLDSDTEAIIRGKWRLALKESRWSDYLSTQATAAEVRDAIVGLEIGISQPDVAVTRTANVLGTGWAWSVTFFNDVGALSLFQAGITRRIVTNTSIHHSAFYRWSRIEKVNFGQAEAPLLLRVDGRGVYSTNKDATLKVSMTSDSGDEILRNATVTSRSIRHAVATYTDAAAASVLHLQDTLGKIEVLRWRSPRQLRLTFSNPPWRIMLEDALNSADHSRNSVITSKVLNISFARAIPAFHSPTKNKFTFLQTSVANSNGRHYLPNCSLTY